VKITSWKISGCYSLLIARIKIYTLFGWALLYKISHPKSHKTWK